VGEVSAVAVAGADPVAADRRGPLEQLTGHDRGMGGVGDHTHPWGRLRRPEVLSATRFQTM
jgi:hypothetical protein